MSIQDNTNLVLYQLPSTTNTSLLDEQPEPIFSVFSEMPQFKYGFYYYIHQTKEKMATFETPEFKNKDYQKIINPFEDVVPQEDFIKQFKNDQYRPSDDINSFSIKYFQSNKIISRAFYKLWELLMMFPLISDDLKTMTSIHIAEAPGSFVQASIYYRYKFFSKNNIDKDVYIATSIEPNTVSNSKNYVPTFGTDLSKFKQFKQWRQDDSNITNPSIIDKFTKEYETTADFVTADGGFNWKNENYQEQEAYILLLSEIYCAGKILKQNGNFVIKFFETFTNPTIKLIDILRLLFENVVIVKPLLSRPSNSERYIVCLNYKKINNNLLDKLYNIIVECNKHKDKYLVDIFPNYKIDNGLDILIKLISVYLSNEQHKQINEMITYINKASYYGDDYRKYLLNRRNANDFWISLFYPVSSKDLEKTRKVIFKLIEQSTINIKSQLDTFSQKINYNIQIKSPSTKIVDNIVSTKTIKKIKNKK